MRDARSPIERGEAVFGRELGSTTIKSTLISAEGAALASATHQWENRLVDGIWTYDMEDVWSGLEQSFASLIRDVESRHGTWLKRFAAGGLSAMMHGYIATDEAGNLLVPFRTWRNSITEEASVRLTELLGWPIPQRWSIAHLTTLAGYVHWKFTGHWSLGIGDASGMFPVDAGAGFVIMVNGRAGH